MSETKSQRENILKYLQAGGKLTGIDALNLFGSFGGFRSRVAELRKEGYKILDEWVKDNGKMYKRYFLEKEEQGQLF